MDAENQNNHYRETLKSLKDWVLSQLETIKESISSLGKELNALKEFVLSQINGLRELIFSEIKGLREFLVTRIESIDKATALLAQTMSEKFLSVNEFRGQLKDQMTLFATKLSLDALVIKLDEFILRNAKEFQELRNTLLTKVEHLTMVKSFDEFKERNATELREMRESLSKKADSSIIQNIINEKTKNLEDRLKPLEDSKQFLAGKASQSQVLVAIGFSCISAIGTIIALIKVFGK